MTKIKPIKPFKTLEEEANFWDTHDVSRIFKNPKTSLSELLSLEPKKEMVITLRVQKIVKDKIDKAAKIKGINSATLSRMWLVERLTKEEGLLY
ncbi:MAG: CopG family antitoxin [Patescibacteria group bacterium]